MQHQQDAEVFGKALHGGVAEANRGVPHADFVAGVRSGTLGFRCVVGEPQQFIRGAPKTMFGVLVLLYTVAPVIAAPLWAWHEHSWWLLLGIVVSAIATGTGVLLSYNQQRQYSIAGFLIIACIGSWLSLGIHSHYTFFALCALWGLVLFVIADNAQKEYAMQSLLERPEIFEDAIVRGRIMIVRKQDETN